MDSRSWMYGRRDTDEYMIGLNEFLECARKNQSVTGERHFPCPCRKCQNVLRQPTIKVLEDHLISNGFQSGYTRWVRHGEPKEYVGNVASGIDVQEELGAENNMDSGIDVRDDVREELRCKNIEIDVQNLDDDQYCINDNLDEMMHDVEPEFADIPEMFENLGKEMSIPLYPGTKLTKTITVFKLYNLKAKNGWSDKSFTSLLELLKEILPENNEIPDSTYKADS
jgi:Transposase-associated domain